jgi:tRNA nucleotidyltransferase (CCA-adding enzyme)
VLDPYDGRDDIDARVVRVLHNDSFVDDPTRIFRAARYAARYEFELEPSTEVFAGAAVQYGALKTVSGGRIGAELQLQAAEAGDAAWAMLDRMGVYEALVDHWGGHGSDIAGSIAQLDQLAAAAGEVSERIWQLRLAAAVLPLGETGAKKFLNEAGLRAKDVTAIVRAVNSASAAGAHETTLSAADAAAVRKLLPPAAKPDDVLLAAAVVGGAAADRLLAYRDAMTKVEFHVTGHDLQSLGMPRGPQIGQVLDDLYEQALSGELVGRDAQIAAAEQLVETVNKMAGA